MANKKTKSDTIAKGYNRKKKGTVPKAAIQRARKAAQEVELLRTKRQHEKWDQEILDLQKKVEKDTEKLLALKKKAGYAENEVLDPGKKEASSSETSMLKDMWRIYRSAGGMARLKQVMKDDKEFRTMVQNMLKVEATISNKRKEGEEAKGVVFVILKGLESETMPLAGGAEMRQIAKALDPTGGDYTG